MSHREVLRKILCHLPVAAVVGDLFYEQSKGLHTTIGPLSAVSMCEPLASEAHQIGEQSFPSPSWMRKTLSRLHVVSLPLPRKITAGEPAFNDATLRLAIKSRQRDEEALKKLLLEIEAARASHDPDKMRQLLVRVPEIAYGKGVTAQMRDDFLARYGCTGWNDDILNLLVDLAGKRGIVEIGAGHGQWARALTDKYMRDVQNRPHAFEFVLAYDDMSDLPLSRQIYHKHTQPSHDFFFAKVRESTDVTSVLRQWTCRARVLMLVYPPPGNLAFKTITSYVEMGPENDTVVYVGEGRGGANADNSFFDFLEAGEWILIDIRDVLSQPGGKGHEQLFIFKRQSVRRPIICPANYAWLCFTDQLILTP